MSLIDDAATLMATKRIAVLTGAGISTESGIPDYRGEGTLRRARNPIQYRDFAGDAEARRRYWSRSMIGWPKMKAAQPNRGHHAVAQLEERGIAGIITQNVDGLHQAAGAKHVVELHGTLSEVVCLECKSLRSRVEVQEWLLARNPTATQSAHIAPDGDADLEAPAPDFAVPTCEKCTGGTIKPNVVFFGENVPRPTVEHAWSILGDSELLLVIGSSLAIFSGYRFVKRAHERGMPIVIVNLGETRGDPLATLKLDGKAGEILPDLVGKLVA